MSKYPVQVLFREYFEGILAALFLALFLRFFVISILYMPTENMEPNLKRGDFIMGWRMVYGFPLPLMRGERLNLKVPEHGDVVSFRFPGDEEQMITRRVIGRPGDEIQIKQGQIILNNRPILEETLPGKLTKETFPNRSQFRVVKDEFLELEKLVVPVGQLFVLSDNRKKSDDSRDWGFVPIVNVESRLGFIWLSVDTQQEGFNINSERLFTKVK